ncbi:MAG: hypothetical protein WCT26_02985 [Candidatus Buchananbacteria bacterium]|jgi:hypothetical protein
MKRPIDSYVGITGFMARAEIEECLACVPTDNQRKFMVGVLASSTTISGQRNTLWNKFPRREDFRKIFFSDSRAFNCLHFATREPEKLYDHLMRCVDFAGENLNGIQLNIPWPDAESIRRVRDQSPRLKFILQVSPHLKDLLRMSIKETASNYAKAYGNLADYFLIDRSRGFGLELDPAYTSIMLERFAEFLGCKRDNAFVVGGGLEAGNLDRLIQPLLVDYPSLSWDSEGKQRDNSDGGGHLVLPNAINYLEKSFALSS